MSSSRRQSACVALLLALAGARLLRAGEPVVAAAGDIACDPGDPAYNGGSGTATACRMPQTAALVAGWMASRTAADAAVLVLGDNQYVDGSLARYQQSYAASWGQGALLALTRPAVGNHEYLTPGAAGYFAYFASGAAHDPAAPLGWYAFDLGGWRLLALNSNCEAVGGCGQGSPQEAWLQNELAAHPNRCTLAYWHHPRFSSGPHGSDPRFDAFWRALYRHGADVVLVGHDHVYERFHHQTPWAAVDAEGPKQFTVGTGGKGLTGLAVPAANSAVLLASTLGVLRLTLHATAYDWEYVSDAGQVLDSGTTACHLRSAPRAASYFAVTPCRLADTRGAAGASGGPALAANAVRFFPAAGACGIPASAVAVAVNATAVGATADGTLRVVAASDVVPGTGVVAIRGGRTRAGAAVVPLGQGGQIAALAVLPAGASTHFVLDVTGYFVE